VQASERETESLTCVDSWRARTEPSRPDACVATCRPFISLNQRPEPNFLHHILFRLFYLALSYKQI